jgi:hypothetical protein
VTGEANGRCKRRDDQKTVNGREYRTDLLRRSYREGKHVRNERLSAGDARLFSRRAAWQFADRLRSAVRSSRTSPWPWNLRGEDAHARSSDRAGSIKKLKERFELSRVFFVSDRGMVTMANLTALRQAQIDRITALKAPQVKALNAGWRHFVCSNPDFISIGELFATAGDSLHTRALSS